MTEPEKRMTEAGLKEFENAAREDIDIFPPMNSFRLQAEIELRAAAEIRACWQERKDLQETNKGLRETLWQIVRKAERETYRYDIAKIARKAVEGKGKEEK